MVEADDTAPAPKKGRAGGFNLEPMAVPQLVALRDAVEAMLQQKQEEAKAALLAKWQAEAAENNLSFKSIVGSQKAAQPQGGKARRKTGGTVAAKFRNPETGDTWTGRGREPTWIKGKNREEFRIEQSLSG